MTQKVKLGKMILYRPKGLSRIYQNFVIYFHLVISRLILAVQLSKLL